MLRIAAVIAMAFALGGCGGAAEEKTELLSYVQFMQEMEPMNEQVVDYIVRLDQPNYEITEADLTAARSLIDAYITKVQSKESTSIAFSELRLIHDMYARKLVQARDQAVDTDHELRRERGNVAIAMRLIEKLTDQHYKGLDVLWLRTHQEGVLPLTWPE